MTGPADIFAAMRDQDRRARAVYGNVPIFSSTRLEKRAPRLPAAQRRRNPKLWTQADRRWWWRLTREQRLHHAFCVGWQRYGEALEAARGQQRDAALSNFRGARMALLRVRHQRRIDEALRLHRPVRNLRDAMKYSWYLDPDWREGEEVHG